MTLKSIPYPIRWRSQLDSTRCTELFATSTSSDRKSTRLNSSHSQISYAVFCLKKKKHEDYIFNRSKFLRTCISDHRHLIGTRELNRYILKWQLAARQFTYMSHSLSQ